MSCIWSPECVCVCLSVSVSRGDTALHKAASGKQHAVCRLLVEAGASLEKTNFQVNRCLNSCTYDSCKFRWIEPAAITQMIYTERFCGFQGVSLSLWKTNQPAADTKSLKNRKYGNKKQALPNRSVHQHLCSEGNFVIVIYISRQSRGKSVDTGYNKRGEVPQGRCDLETCLKIKSFFSFSHSLTFFRF